MEISETLTDLIIPIDSVAPHPENPREGDVGAISVSLDEFGQYRPIVVQLSSQYIVAGNHTWRGAKALGSDSIAATWIDVDDATALRIMLADNRLADLGFYDQPTLIEHLLSIGADPQALRGTGYDPDDLAKLLEEQAAPMFPDAPDDESVLNLECPRCGFAFNKDEK